MKPFLQSRVGAITLLAFVVMMTVVGRHVLNGRRERLAAVRPATPPVAAVVAAGVPVPVPPSPRTPAPAPAPTAIPALVENAAYLDGYLALDRRVRDERDGQGNAVTRRDTAPATPRTGASVHRDDEVPLEAASAAPRRASLRLQGRPGPAVTSTRPPPAAVPAGGDGGTRGKASEPAHPKRFNPFGRVVKCELVFTLDSTNELTPLVGLVMEPVYNNGVLVIPAGAELHGSARPDRLRDRIFSGADWVLVFPREAGRPNGRQLNVKGVALDRIEPDVNGMTWGITDGSYGLEGRIIRSMNDEEIRRFVATFLAGSSVALQQRRSDRLGQEAVSNTPQNAVLQGLAANFDKIASDISKEIEAHGVFIRVPAGHQFYFYPMQIIDPDRADISSDIALVK